MPQGTLSDPGSLLYVERGGLFEALPPAHRRRPDGRRLLPWDRALKRGDPRTIGTLAYLTPLASTSLMALFGGGRLGASSVMGAGLTVGGEVVGSWSLGLAGRPGP